ALGYGEILNVLLFDDPSGEADDATSPGASAVTTTLASAGLSRSLADLTNLNISAKLGTTASGSTRPELGIRVSTRLEVGVAYNAEPTSSLSEPPDTGFVSLDWRVSNAWSLESVVGNQGSAVADIVWRYRY